MATTSSAATSTFIASSTPAVLSAAVAARVVRDPVDLGQYPERIGVLDEAVRAPRVKRRAGQQLAHSLCDPGLTASAACRLDALVKDDRVGIQCLERERRHLEPACLERARV